MKKTILLLLTLFVFAGCSYTEKVSNIILFPKGLVESIIQLKQSGINKPILSTDYEDFKKNFYKYRDILITFEPKNPNAKIIRSEEYNVFLTKKGEKEILFGDLEVGMYNDVIGLKPTKNPYILEVESGFGDAGVYSIDHLLIDLESNVRLSINFSGQDNNNNSNPSFAVHGEIFSLANQNLMNKCSKNLEINYLLKNNKTAIKLPKSTYLQCYEERYGSNPSVSFYLVGATQNLQKLYILLSYSDPQLNEKDTSIIYEFNAKTGDIKEIKDDSWKKDNILGETPDK